MDKKLYKSQGDRKLCGVCGGLGEYFDIDPTLVRVLCVAAIFFSFSAVFWIYLICAFIIPKKSDVYPGY